MWKLTGVLAAIAVLAALPLSHRNVSAQPDLQLLCHVAGDGAHIIAVSPNAVPAHLEKHGDCLINSTDRTLVGTACDATDANTNDICDIQP
jgi:hypothetical protein